MNTNSKKTRKRAPLPKPKVRAGAKAVPQAVAGPTKSRVKPAVSRKNKPGPKPDHKPVPKPAPKHLPKPTPRHRPTPRQKQRPQPIRENPMENASLQAWLSVQREKEQKMINAQAALAKEVQNRYQAQVNSELRDYADRSMLAYRIQQDPRQRKANEVMREEDLGHVDTIYSDQDLADIEEMFGPFTNTRPIVNPMQVQSLRESILERKAQAQTQRKRSGTLRSRKHKGQGTGF